MVWIACASAMKASKRAVICGGWAKLSMDTLKIAIKAETDGEQLLAYAEANILFVDTAPHERLFPRCACIVHHGGSGTTAASLRSGKPTIVTPICLDQYDQAEIVARLGVGIGCKQLNKLTDDDVSAAIIRACTDTAIISNAAEVGQKLLGGNGVQTAITEIENVLTSHAKGQLPSFIDAVRERQDALNSRRKCCTVRANGEAKKHQSKGAVHPEELS